MILPLFKANQIRPDIVIFQNKYHLLVSIPNPFVSWPWQPCYLCSSRVTLGLSCVLPTFTSSLSCRETPLVLAFISRPDLLSMSLLDFAKGRNFILIPRFCQKMVVYHKDCICYDVSIFLRRI